MAKSDVHDISQITDQVYLSSWPEGRHDEEILGKNIRLILSMHWRLPERDLRRPPLRLLWLPSIDSPLTPIPMNYLDRGTRAALETIQGGHAVLVHCKYGVHRSVVMTCCVLVGLGYDAQAAMKLVSEQRAAADPYAPYVEQRIRVFERHWREAAGGQPG